MVAGPDKGTRRYVIESHCVRNVLERLEFVGVPVPHDRQVALGRTQVLADRQNLDFGLAELTERVDHLLERFA
jgi:hypothetical protein